MVKNLVLDMGNVLLGWAPEAFALQAAGNKADAVVLNEALFASPDWPLHDAGGIEEQELLRRALARTPDRLQDRLRQLFEQWPHWMPAVPGALEMVTAAKKAALNVYMLSNAGTRFPDVLTRQPFYPLLDGLMVSAHERVSKPHRALYDLLCSRFGLVPAECLFVDDLPPNAQGAREAGMQAVVFEGDWAPVYDALRQMGANIRAAAPQGTP